MYSFSFFAPLTPPPWFLGSEPKFAEPAARPEGAAQSAAAIFGNVYEVNQYTRHGALRQTNQIFQFPACLSNEYVFALITRPNRAVGSPFPPGGAGKGRG